MNREKDTKYAKMIIIDGLLKTIYQPLDSLDLSIAREMVQDRLHFIEGVAFPSLFDVRGVQSISKEARDYMADEGNELVIASALVINSAVLRMMGNFFISVNQPKKPTQIFTAEEKAVHWLNGYRNQ
ncbi:MAG: hypothetical protein AAF789_03250 [Bacteroidota bacterium]